MKKYIFIGVVAAVAAIVYYTGLYTYFLRTNVQEELPVSSSGVTGQTETLATGRFTEIDFIHKGSGEAKLIRVDGRNILRFENFDVTSGPDLYVYLSKSESPGGGIESLGDYIDLGLLKGTSGNQNYEINANIGGYKTAVVWCKRFGVLFTYAVMR